VDLGEMMVTVGAGEWGKARGGRGPHIAMRQLTRRRRRRLTRCNSCVNDEWVHERGRIEHKPYFIRRSTGFSENLLSNEHNLFLKNRKIHNQRTLSYFMT
jgi:hypothetical protein